MAQKTEQEIIEALKQLEQNRIEYENRPEVKQAFKIALEKFGGYHIQFDTNDDSFIVFDEKICYDVILLKNLFNVDSQSLFYNSESNISYLSILINKPMEIFNHSTFDNYCIEVCKKLLKEKGKEFPINDYDITVSYPTTIEGIDIDL